MRPRSATSGCCSSTGSRSWTPSAPGRCWRTGRGTTPRTAGRISCLSADGADVIGAKNLVLGAHHSFEDAPALDVLIHPGGHGTRRLLRDPDHLDWVRAQRAAVPLMASVCTGSLVYAAAGLLKGRPATTHWASLNLLSELDPTVMTDVDARFVDDGDLHHQRRGLRRHRHGPAPGGPPGREPSAPVRYAAASSTTRTRRSELVASSWLIIAE